MATEHFDVLIVGAGISGISAGYHLQTHCPHRSYAILERRDNIGGTWDLFRYPGIRSDSDMYTLGYSFEPWRDPKAIADGPSILKYVRGTAAKHGIDRHIQYGHHVKRASWSTPDAQWTVETETSDGEVARFTCNFLFMCSGYYNYDEGYTPDFPGAERFPGPIVHPQKWTDDIDYAGKRVVVIGSGATAVTLVPSMAETAAHVTMLQRSPTYVVSLPSQDRVANFLRRKLPAKLAYRLTRWKQVIFGMLFFQFCRRFPDRARRLVLAGVRQNLGPDYDIKTHFNPKYDPWDQRMCLVPDADLFDAIKAGKASVVTDQIESFTEKGIALQSGTELEADMIVTATGLKLQFLADLQVTVDDKRIRLPETMTYKGMMFSDIPNLAMAMGYTNASWTLKCDLTCEYVCRILNHMERNGHAQCCPRLDDPSVEEEDMLPLTAGYIMRSLGEFPKQGNKAPWKLYQNYFLDTLALGYGAVDDGSLVFSSPSPEAKAAEAA